MSGLISEETRSKSVERETAFGMCGKGHQKMGFTPNLRGKKGKSEKMKSLRHHKEEKYGNGELQTTKKKKVHYTDAMEERGRNPAHEF